jgi:hypothetical protein
MLPITELHMITWPLAIISIVAIVCITIIVCAGKLWTDEWQQCEEEARDWEDAKRQQRIHDLEAAHDILNQPQPTRPSPPPEPPIVTHNHDHQWIDNTALNDLPNSRYLCATCSASRLDLAECDADV